MPIKNFETVFRSKKTQHPEGQVERKYHVTAATRGIAQIVARGRLEEDEPDTHKFFKAPIVTLIKPEPEIVDEFEEAPERAISPDEIEDAVYLQADMDEEKNATTDIAEPLIEPDPIPSQPEAVLEPEAEVEEEPVEKVIFENGTYDMPNFVYHQSEGISSSMVKKACESLMYYQGLYVTKTIKQTQGDALRFGNLFHTLVLEPNMLAEEYIVLDKTIDRRTKAGKEAYNIVMDTAEQKHLTVVTNEQFVLANEMAGIAINDPYATKLLRSPTRRTEVSYFATHPTTGLQVKVRPDLSVGDVCIDLKTIHINRSVDGEWMLEHLRREIIKYKYHLSAAMYLEVAKLKEFVWIFVNKAPGYHWVATIRATEKLLTEGEDLYHTTMQRIYDATQNDVWPGPMSIMPTVQDAKIILPEV